MVLRCPFFILCNCGQKHKKMNNLLEILCVFWYYTLKDTQKGLFNLAGRVRKFKFTQYEKHPVTGEELFNERYILDGLAKREDGLKRWAYVLHDKDTYTEHDVPEGKSIGDIKPRHWHVVLEFKNGSSFDSVAKSFKLPTHLVEKVEGYHGFWDMMRYFTHMDEKQQALGKHVYELDEIKVSDDKVRADYEKFLEKKLEVPDSIENMLEKVRTDGMSLRDAKKKLSAMDSTKYYAHLKRARDEYLQSVPLPQHRTNYYVTGLGGTGKSTFAMMMAKSMFPDLPDDECFYIVGDRNVALDEYNGQPVIIWDDWRANTFISQFGRETVFKMFDVVPKEAIFNKKFGSVRLINSVNIVTAVTSFKDFISGLSGNFVDRFGNEHVSEDDTQAYRRFPFFVEVSSENVEVYASYYATGMKNGPHQTYSSILRMYANIREIATSKEGVSNKAIEQVSNPVVEKIKETEYFKKGDERKDYDYTQIRIEHNPGNVKDFSK